MKNLTFQKELIFIVFLSLVSCVQIAEAKVTTAEVFNVLQKSKNSLTIDEAISQLPKEMLRNHVIMFESKSLQQASYTNPRVLLFNDEATFIVSFNGSVEQRGFDSIETMRFIGDNDNRFVFEQIIFIKDQAERKKYLDSRKGLSKDAKELANIEQQLIDLKDAYGVKVGPNAPACVACHRTDPRPNWEPYPLWPGAYGQDDSRTLSLSLRSPTYPESDRSHRLESIFKTQASVRKRFPEFLRRADKTERYKWLLNLESQLPETLSLDLIKTAKDLSGFEAEVNKKSRGRLPSKLTSRLAFLNNKRIVRMLMAAPDWNKRKYLFAAGMLSEGCGSITEFYSLTSMDKDIWWADSFSSPVEFYYKMQNLLEGSDISASDLSMAFFAGPQFTGFATPGGFGVEMLYLLVQQDPDLKKEFTAVAGPIEKYVRGWSYSNLDYPPMLRFKPKYLEEEKAFCTRMLERHKSAKLK